MTTLRFPVGRQRIGRSVNPSEASYTQAIRGQMQAIIDNAQKVIDGINAESAEGLRYALQPIFDESQILVPKKTGKLAASGFIETQQKGSGGATGVVGYAKGGDPQYAVWVHEFMERFHTPPTQAKFLEDAVSRHLDEVPQRYAEYIRFQIGL